MDASSQGRASRRSPPADPELPLLDLFRSAALSVSKLYTTSISAHVRSRAEGYSECLEDLLAFVDRERIGLSETSEGYKVRRWAAERIRNGREEIGTIPQLDGGESDDEEIVTARQPEGLNSSPEPQAPPQPQSPQHAHQQPLQHPPQSQQQRPRGADIPARNNSDPMTDAPPPSIPIIDQLSALQFAAPSLDNFTFQSSHPYPNIGDLDLSDSRTAPMHATTNNNNNNNNNTSTLSSATPPSSKRYRHGRHGRPTPTPIPLGRGAGSKRKLNLSEIFGFGNLSGKDMFGPGAKRGRHT